MVGDGYFLYGVPNRYLNSLLLVLKEAVRDQYDYIEWWLYEESPDFRVYEAEGSRKWDLATPEALYEYIVTECQAKG